MQQRNPNVFRLAVHLPGDNTVLFEPDADPASLANNERLATTTLTAFFTLCSNDSSARRYRYTEICRHYTYDK